MTINLDDRSMNALVAEALAMRSRAHAPYSRFQVGAALLSTSGDMFAGCNIENASFSLSVCAERVAAGSAVAGGHTHWTAIAVASRGGVTPCGACRQFLAEFGGDLLVLSVDAESKLVKRFHLSALLPDAFDATALPAR